MSLGRRFSAAIRTGSIIRFLANTRGLSLLELIIALLILQIAITGFAQLFMAGLDLSRKARLAELAQILAQTKMEELSRTVPGEAMADNSTRLLPERPAAFEDVNRGTVDANSLRWIAEVVPQQRNPQLVTISLHVYNVSSRHGKRQSSEQDFYLSEDKTRFTYIQPAEDGAVEVIQGKEQLCLTSAVAIPRAN